MNVAGPAVPATLVKPEGDSTAPLLSATWIWPVLIWSRLGAQRRENRLDSLPGCYPSACACSILQVMTQISAAVLMDWDPGAGNAGPGSGESIRQRRGQP